MKSLILGGLIGALWGLITVGVSFYSPLHLTMMDASPVFLSAFILALVGAVYFAIVQKSKCAATGLVAGYILSLILWALVAFWGC